MNKTGLMNTSLVMEQKTDVMITNNHTPAANNHLKQGQAWWNGNNTYFPQYYDGEYLKYMKHYLQTLDQLEWISKYNEQMRYHLSNLETPEEYVRPNLAYTEEMVCVNVVHSDVVHSIIMKSGKSGDVTIFDEKLQPNTSFVQEHDMDNDSGNDNTQLDVQTYPCSHCNMSFTFASNLSIHLESHTYDEPFQCLECGDVFAQFSAVTKHMKTHNESGKDEFQCDQCQSTFSDREEFKIHMKSHGERPFRCPHCPAAFRVPSGLDRHIRTHTGERPYQCTDCNAAFKQSGHLQDHKRIHTGEKPYLCKVCGTAFTRSQYLKKHMTFHTGITAKFQCSLCSQTFTVKDSLTRHMRNHTGEKPYKCDTCGAAFRQSAHLHSHMRTHGKEGPFRCKYCNEAFCKSSQFRQHMQIHTKKKPKSSFECPDCGMSFTVKSSLVRHIRIHTGEKPYKCMQCGVAYRQSAHLLEHRRRHGHI